MTTTRETPYRSPLLRAAAAPATLGMLAWLVGVTFDHPGAVTLGAVFAAVGLGLVGAATVRSILRLQGGLGHPAAIAGVAVVCAAAVYYTFASTAELLGVSPSGT